MEMPKNCDVCRFHDKPTWGDHVCIADLEFRIIKDINVKPEWCLLIEVPNN